MLIYHLIPEAVALLLFFITTIYVLGEKEILRRNDQKRFFRVAFWASFSIIENFFASFLVMGVLIFPLPVNYLMQTLYYILIFILETSMFDLVMGTVRMYTPNQQRIDIETFISRCLAVVGIVCILINLRTGWIFSIRGPNQLYIRGPFNIISAVLGSIMILMAVSCFIFEKAYLPPQFMRISGYMPFFAILLMVYQIIFKNMQMTGLIGFVVTFFWLLNISSDTMLTDNLTGLGNRKLMMSSLSYFFERHSEFGLYVINIRNLTKLSADLGVRTYDSLLVDISTKLTSFNGMKQVFRMVGKDIFVLIGPAPSDGSCNSFCNRLIDLFSDLWHIDGSDIGLKTEITMIPCPVVASDVDEVNFILNYVMSASVVKMSESRNVYFTVCDLKMKERINRQEYVFQLLTEALDSGKMRFFFQPIYKSNGEYRGYAECLARLWDPKIGKYIPPSEFIPIAEKEGLIGAIGKAGLEYSCKIIHKAVKSGVNPPTISVNFSARQFYNKNVVSVVLDVLKQYDVPAQYIKIEITESYLIENFDVVKRAMVQLVDNGVGFYLDDFGSGYASISKYVNLPFECIKFDHGMLASARPNNKTDIFLKAIVPCFMDLGFKIVFEGVEASDSLSYVNSFGSVFVQGFYFSHPLKSADFCALLGMGDV